MPLLHSCVLSLPASLILSYLAWDENKTQAMRKSTRKGEKKKPVKERHTFNKLCLQSAVNTPSPKWIPGHLQGIKNRLSVLKLRQSSAIGSLLEWFVVWEVQYFPLIVVYPFKKLMWAKTRQGRAPNIAVIYKKTSSSILHADLSIANYVNVVLLTCYGGGYILTLLPRGLLHPP